MVLCSVGRQLCELVEAEVAAMIRDCPRMVPVKQLLSNRTQKKALVKVLSIHIAAAGMGLEMVVETLEAIVERQSRRGMSLAVENEISVVQVKALDSLVEEKQPGSRFEVMPLGSMSRTCLAHIPV